MTKYPISWHEENLKNAKITLANDRRYVELKIADLAALNGRVVFAEKQIAEARKRGMTEFDSQKLLIRKGKK